MTNNVYKVEVETEGREVYHVEASNEEDARRQVNECVAGEPTVSEVTGGSIVNVELYDV